MPSYGHERGGDLSFPMIQEKIQPGAAASFFFFYINAIEE